MSISGAADDQTSYDKYYQDVLSLENELDSILVRRFKTTSSIDNTAYPIVLADKDYQSMTYISSYEFAKFFESYTVMMYKYELSDWAYDETKEPLFNDNEYRFFIGKINLFSK